MTTERELHDLLTTEADAPGGLPPAWDDIVRRGRHHRRVARVRSGLIAGGVAALAVIAGINLTGRVDDENTGVLADDPVTTTTRDLRVPDNVGLVPDLAVARVEGNRVTLILGPADPESGFDPCRAVQAVVTETDAQVSISYGLSYDNRWYDSCQSSPFSGSGTIELDAPLGSRRLVDAIDGKAIEVVDDADLLFPSELPSPFDVDQWDEFAQVTPEGLAVHEREWTFSWTQDDLVLNVSWWSLDGEHPTGCTEGEVVTVRGVDGRLCTNESSALLTWVDGDSIRIIELVHVGAEALPDGIDLVAVADGLQPLG